jgi:hypothetical protein
MKDETIYRMFLVLLGVVVLIFGVNTYEAASSRIFLSAFANQAALGEAEMVIGAILLIVAVFFEDIIKFLKNL